MRRLGLDGLTDRTRTNRWWAAQAVDALRGEVHLAAVLDQPVVLAELGRHGDAAAIRAAAAHVVGLKSATAIQGLRRRRGAPTRRPVLRRARRDELVEELQATIVGYRGRRLGCDAALVRDALAHINDAPNPYGKRTVAPSTLRSDSSEVVARDVRGALAKAGFETSDFGSIVLVNADARRVLPFLRTMDVASVVFDPPYGDSTPSWPHRTRRPAIEGDKSTEIRDFVLRWAAGLPVAVFGSWKQDPPAGARARVVWDKGPACGMGYLSLPWKNTAEDIYILGGGWTGARDEGVLRFPVPHAGAHGRRHPHEKPVELIMSILTKAPPGLVLDPCCGSGSTLLAAMALGRPAVGIDVDAKWIDVARQRLERASSTDSSI